MRYQDKSVVVEDADDITEETVLVSISNKVITITAANSLIDAVSIYDFSGALIRTKDAVNTAKTTISDLAVNHVPLLVQVLLENGKKVVKKVIY